MMTHGGLRSIPEMVMRTGVMRSINPLHARADINPQRVLEETSMAVGENPANNMPEIPAPLPPAIPGPVTDAVAATTTATPPQPMTPAVAPAPMGYPHPHHWQRRHTAYNGRQMGQWNGAPVASFQIAQIVSPDDGQSAVQALQHAARLLRSVGHGALPPEIVGGPLAALIRGGAVELHFQNGVVVRAAP
jgi:hypothetical protein